MRLKVSYNSPVILSFSLACAVVLLVSLVFGENVALQFTVGSSDVAGQVVDWSNPLTYFRFVSHALGHIDVGHLSGNILLLLLIGPLLEEKYGRGPLVAMMLSTALVTGLIHTFLFSGLLMGASGIVFMFITLSSFTNRKTGELPITMIVVVIAYLGQEWMAFGEKDNISHFAHIAGGIMGVIFGFLQKVDQRENV